MMIVDLLSFFCVQDDDFYQEVPRLLSCGADIEATNHDGRESQSFR
jgi:hypothetical protein